MKGRSIGVHTRRPLAVNTDGEVTTRTPAAFEVIPQAVTVLVPPTYPARAPGA